MEKRGVFLRSESSTLDSALMIKCLQTLHNNYPSIKFSSISSDEKLSGFRVCFTEPEEAVILEKNQLEIANQSIWIYPLTAYLVILDIKKNTTRQFDRELEAAISRKFGTILNVKTDSFDNHKNWHVQIDIPEFKQLDVFRCIDLSEITVSIPNRNETLKVAFWCRHCQKGGHFLHECPTRDHPATSAKSQVKNLIGSTTENCKNDTQIRDNLQAHGVETNDDDIQIAISDRKSPVESLSPDSNLAIKAAELSISEDDSKSPRAARNDDSSIPSCPTTPGSSFETPSAPRPRGVNDTAVLSKRLQDCINYACESVGVLDRQKLDAFFIHVKKKGNPAREALNYTEDEKGLKEQLKKILEKYYTTPEAGTKEDTQFIKWLKGLIERYDVTIPRKKK